MQETEPARAPPPSMAQQEAPENDRHMDSRPLGGADIPHKHPFPTSSMDPRPLGAGKSVPEENEADNQQDGDTQKQSAHHVDEVDASPEEQFTRHHVELDLEKLNHEEGRLEHVKKKVGEAVHAARVAVEQHLPLSLTHDEDTAPSAHSQSNITLNNLKYNNHSEPMNMAKVAAGPNRTTVNDISAVESGGGGASKRDDDFPETLQDAIQDGAHVSEKEKKKEDEKIDEQLEGNLNEPEPFGVTSGARSKL